MSPAPIGPEEAFRATFAGEVGNLDVSVALWPTPLGPMLAAAVAEGVCLLVFAEVGGLKAWRDHLVGRFGRVGISPEHPHLEALRKALGDYFRRGREVEPVPVVCRGSEFARAVWRELRRIPPGQTRSYQDVAAALGCPGGARAVGRATGANLLYLLVPCHRVVRSGGGLGGFGGGLWRKRALLALEAGHLDLASRPSPAISCRFP